MARLRRWAAAAHVPSGWRQRMPPGWRRRVPQWAKSAGWLVCGTLSLVPLGVAGAFLYLEPQVPATETYLHYRPQAPMRVFSADGAFMAEFGERRFIPVALQDVPEHFKNALLDTEDKRFYEHGGIDYISLADDVIGILLNPDVRTGASTITMQLARNVSFSLEQTFIRKFKEMLLAIKIEQELTKEQVLELYINVLFFGKRAYGAQAAAHTYYDKPLAELNLAQLAMLAGIVKRPDAGNPINGPEWALQRRNLVLRRMLQQGSIGSDAYLAARDAPITAQVHRRTIELSAPYVAEWVRHELVERYGEAVYGSGYAAYATVVAEHQRAATEALRGGLLGYDRRHGYRGALGHVALDAGPPALAAALPGAGVDATRQAPAWDALLADFSPSAGLVPMVVTGVAEREFTAVDGSGAVATVTWDGMAWARSYIDHDRRGPRPRAAADIVAPGDIVRLRRLDDGAWALAQVPDIQGALVALRPTDGAVTALAGGFDFWGSQFNHALQAARQPGSAFKPFVYSAALDAGVTPATVIVDAPLVFEDPSFATPYRPRNDSGRYNGPTRLREALYRSINLVSIQVLQRVGVDQVLEHVRRFGFDTSSFPANTQLAIGGGTMSVTPLDMARAYAVVANGGYAVTPHILKRVEGRDGEMLFEPRHPVACDACETAALAAAAAPGETSLSEAVPAPRAIDPRNVFILDSMLRDVIARGTGRRARSLERGDLAGKTGTTNEAADTWFNGYNAHLAASVWVGFDDYRPVGRREYGSTTPLSVWMDFMRVALEGLPDATRPQPQGVVSVKIHPEKGCAASADDPDAVFEYFLAEHPPARRCPEENLSPERIF